MKNEKMENLETKEKNSKGKSNYSVWLEKLANGRKYLKELAEEEIYNIILEVAKITFTRYPVLSLDHSYEDAAGIIYRNFKQRDFEKQYDDTFDTSNIKFSEDITEKEKIELIKNIKQKKFPYYDEKKNKFYNWQPREECKGFKRMKDSNMSIIHFSNIIFRELENHYNGNSRDKKFYNRLNNTVSLDYEDENLKMIERISDNKDNFEDVDLDVAIKNIDNSTVHSDYSIVINNNDLKLSFSNLLKLYSYLANGKRVTSSEILKHIKYKDNENLSKDNISYIGRFISSFKKYLIESGTVSCSNTLVNGKEEKKYAFA